MKRIANKIFAFLAAAVVLLGTGFIPKPIPTLPEDIPIIQPDGDNDDGANGSEDKPQCDDPSEEIAQ